MTKPFLLTERTNYQAFGTIAAVATCKSHAYLSRKDNLSLGSLLLEGRHQRASASYLASAIMKLSSITRERSERGFLHFNERMRCASESITAITAAREPEPPHQSRKHARMRSTDQTVQE